MSDVIDKYIFEKNAAAKSQEWASLLGKAGHCGDVGKIHGIYLHKRFAEIVYQECPGAKNYHEPPESLTPYMTQAITEKFNELLGRALELQAAAVTGLAAKAVEDHYKMMADAGLQP